MRGKRDELFFIEVELRMHLWSPSVQMGGKVRKYVGHRSIITEEKAINFFFFLHVCRTATAGDDSYGY